MKTVELKLVSVIAEAFLESQLVDEIKGLGPKAEFHRRALPCSDKSADRKLFSVALFDLAKARIS